MNILLIGQFLYPDTIGGAGRYLRDLAEALIRQRHRVVVMVPECPGRPRHETRDGMDIIRYGSLQHWWRVPASLLAVRRAFRSLHHQRPFDLIGVHQPLPAWILLFDRHARRLRWVHHFHSPWAEEFKVQYAVRRRRTLDGVEIWARKAIERQVTRQARRRIVLSHSMKAILAATHRVPAEEISVIPGAVNLERFRPATARARVRESLGIPPDCDVLFTARALVPRQNLDGLIRSMAVVVRERPAALLAIAGPGPLAQELRALTSTLGLDAHVRLLGGVSDDDLLSWYQAADLFVMPSKALEGFGLATLEALACGVPAVGTPVGGTKELLTQLDPALLCEGTEPRAIASTLLATFERLKDPSERTALSNRCRKFAAQFSIEAVVERIDALYQQLVRVRVLHLHTVPVVSGSGLNTFLSMCGQRDAGFDVEIGCAPGGSLLDLVEREGLLVRRLQHMVWPIHPWHDLLVIGELWRLMRRQRYAIVHTHNSKAGFVGRLAARLAGVPVVVHTVHGYAFHDRERPWKRWVYRALERLASGWCDRLIMISQPLVDWALRERIGPRDKMVKIYSGIDLQAFRVSVDRQALRASLGVRAEDFVVGEVAKLWAGKGQEVLLRAAASLRASIPSLKLLIIGEGGRRPALERLAEELDMRTRVVFTGFRDDVPALTQSLDLAVLPSFFEGMGRAVLEAQAAGKAVIASRVGGIPDLIADGVTGLLVDPGSVEELASAIRRLYEQPELRKRIGQAARAATNEKFSSQTMVQQILAVYDDLLATKARGVAQHGRTMRPTHESSQSRKAIGGTPRVAD